MSEVNQWAEKFVTFAEELGANCRRVRYNNGWLETAVIAGRMCFTKSVTFQTAKRLYFLGVDPGKLRDKGDAVVLCGGARGGGLRDIFVIPWQTFFGALGRAEPINTYKDADYLQYKSHVRERSEGWTCVFEGGSKPVIDLRSMRYDPDDAVEVLKMMAGSLTN